MTKRYLLFLIALVSSGVQASSSCSEIIATIISVQGKVDSQSLGEMAWQPVKQNDTFCNGDKLRTAKHSRATVTMVNESRVTLGQNTTMTFMAPDQETSSWFINLLEGAAFFRSRQPQRLNIQTPFINAVHEGTEFLVNVSSVQTEITVFDGLVAATNRLGKIKIAKGFSGIATKNHPPRIQALTIYPEDAVQWTLYYPPLIDVQNPDYTKTHDLDLVINAYQQGDVSLALTRLDALSDTHHNAPYLLLKASLLLSVGSVNDALTLINKVKAMQPENSTTFALLSIIAVTKNRQADALKLAQTAVTLNPQSAVAHLALSYAFQALFKLESALRSTQEAVRLSPDNALAWARLSELQLSTGERGDALNSAQKAQQLNPNLARTQIILGFAYLVQVDFDAAKLVFTKAITLNSADPLAWLGLGLANIRTGAIAAGARDLETAVSLDPDNAILRSYLGKAYYERKEVGFASTELAIAKEKDPKDPTPWYYDAILKQTTNRPVEALHAMQKAIELNNNRAVYRSRLLLDEDYAARTANLARIYQDLGFDRKALIEAWKSSSFDRRNYSTHRFISDANLNAPRHRITANSELLQSQLLQPLNISPIQPQQAGVNAFILNDTGPSSLSLNEYNPLFLSNGAHLLANGLVGSNDTWAENVIVSGIWNKVSASFGQFHYETDAKTSAFPDNKDFKRDGYSAFAQYLVSPALTFQVELKTEDITSGDSASHINDPKTDGFFADSQKQRRERIEQDTIRVGGHYQANVNNDVILSGIYTTLSEREPATLFSRGISTYQRGYQLETKQLLNFNALDTQLGLGYTQLAVNDALLSDNTKEEHSVNGYLYVNLKPIEWFSSTLGISVDSYDYSLVKKTQVNPKLGVFLMPHPDVVFRAAFFRSLKRSFVTNQTIEPSQISGFNQFYDDNNGTDSWNYGVGMDYQVTNKMYAGAEFSWRRINQKLFDIFQQRAFTENRHEKNGLAYLYWVPLDYMAARVEYKLETFNREFIVGRFDSFAPEGITNHVVPFSINFFNGSGFFLKLGGNYVNQQVNFVTEEESIPLDGELFKERSSFWVFDTTIGYRLPKRLGAVSFEVKNIFDNYFSYQSSFDAFAQTLPAYFPERQLSLNVRLTF